MVARKVCGQNHSSARLKKILRKDYSFIFNITDFSFFYVPFSLQRLEDVPAYIKIYIIFYLEDESSSCKIKYGSGKVFQLYSRNLYGKFTLLCSVSCTMCVTRWYTMKVLYYFLPVYCRYQVNKSFTCVTTIFRLNCSKLGVSSFIIFIYEIVK